MLFDKAYDREPGPIRRFDMSPTDGRFLLGAWIGSGPEFGTYSLIVVQHWFEELRARVK